VRLHAIRGRNLTLQWPLVVLQLACLATWRPHHLMVRQQLHRIDGQLEKGLQHAEAAACNRKAGKQVVVLGAGMDTRAWRHAWLQGGAAMSRPRVDQVAVLTVVLIPICDYASTKSCFRAHEDV
jgi:Leucine carboxyl methyltransferase